MRHLSGFIIIFFVLACNRNVERIPDLNASLITGRYYCDSLPSSLLLGSHNLVPEEYNSSLIKLDSNGRFKIPITIEYPQTLSIMVRRPTGPLMASQSIGLFIFPGDTINIDLSDSIKVKCNNSFHQDFILNYLTLIDLIQESQNEFPFHESVQKDSPEKFISKQIEFRNQLRENILTFIKENNIQNKEFHKMALLEAEYVTASHLIDYKLLNRIFHKREVELPKHYFSLADSLANIENDNHITYNYFSFLNRLQIIYSTEKIDTLLKLINYESKTLTQDILLGRSLLSVLNKDTIQVATKYFNTYKNKIRSTIIRQELDEQYNNKLAFLNNPKAKNAFLTDLSLKTDNNSIIKQVTKDHKGKIIYVKFWGPWCGPCMEELPFDKMLINELNPNEFAFVNLCVKTKKEDWEYTISNKKISGFHYLLNDNQYNELADLFNINGIPFHLLIGKDGKIIENNAPGPGSVFLDGLDQTFLNELKRLTTND